MGDQFGNNLQDLSVENNFVGHFEVIGIIIKVFHDLFVVRVNRQVVGPLLKLTVRKQLHGKVGISHDLS